jgi:hypothetical protein
MHRLFKLSFIPGNICTVHFTKVANKNITHYTAICCVYIESELHLLSTYQIILLQAVYSSNRTCIFCILIELHLHLLCAYRILLLYDKIFIYCNWVPTRWRWSVNSYKNRKETAMYQRGNNTPTLQKHRIHKLGNRHTKQENKNKRNNKQQKSSN